MSFRVIDNFLSNKNYKTITKIFSKLKGNIPQKTGKSKYPICSLIFYIEIKNLKGGELILAGDIIKPKSNRLVIFDPGLHHSVNEFKGIRKVFLVNPWTHKPEAFKNEVV